MGFANRKNIEDNNLNFMRLLFFIMALLRGNLMKSLRIFWLLFIAVAVHGAPARAAPTAKDVWIGAWGFSPTPPLPNCKPTVPKPQVIPPSSSQQVAPAKLRAAPPLLLDNPGNVPVASGYGDLANVTFRQLVRVAVAGKRVRLRFSNEGNSNALTLGAVQVGAAGPDGSLIAGSNRKVTFDGSAGVTIPDHALWLSDPIDLEVDSLEKLIISVYVPGILPRTGHNLYHYVAGTPGNHAAETNLPSQRIIRLPALVSEVDVDPITANGVIVTMGDSITEGALSTANAFRSWPDRLAERLAMAHSKFSVVNAGINGNRLLRDGTGPSALARLDRDVLSVPGIRAIILLEGINDISMGTYYSPDDPLSVDTLISGYKQIIERAHAKGVKVYGGTLTPYKGGSRYTAAGEKVRKSLNEWIKTSRVFDGVVDFASSIADMSDPETVNPAFNLDDKLHPNDAGYHAMANAIDMRLFK